MVDNSIARGEFAWHPRPSHQNGPLYFQQTIDLCSPVSLSLTI